MGKKYKALDMDGMPLSDQAKLLPELCKKKYQVTIKLENGRLRYAFTNDPKVIEIYVKKIKATILKVAKL